MAVTRSFLVVVDDTPESRVAMRFAALRAAHIDGRVILLHTMHATEFMQWGGVQELIEAESRAKAEALLSAVADELFVLSGQRPGMIVREGEVTAADSRDRRRRPVDPGDRARGRDRRRTGAAGVVLRRRARRCAAVPGDDRPGRPRRCPARRADLICRHRRATWPGHTEGPCPCTSRPSAPPTLRR